ncbi:MAG: endonuclease/exonuclease/phosphatase family protein [Verrucomicrobiota bacterium]|nr:endonuclease/exonuclease/phosphatase family protein [Verrucomicrobiota bacterium]
MRRYFSRSEWAVRRLHLPTSQETENEHGLLLIQIDGLSKTQMERAMRRGRLPFLKSLLQKQKYELHTFYSGLPSTTPAVQAELYYGVRCAVPAFCFLDRSVQKVVTMFKPDCAKSVEQQLGKKGEGLLKGGSSWSNIFTGGAAESHFCPASIGWDDMLKSASLSGYLSLVLLQINSVLRVVALTVIEFFLALRDFVGGVTQGENIFEEIKFVFSRVLVGVALREFIAIGAKIDLARGLPIIHINFLGYDEQAHRRGPDSAFAHWSLKGIDRVVRGLDRAAQRSHRRDYQVWIFSDHGQERAQSFAEHFPGGIETVIRQGLKKFKKIEVHGPLRSQNRESPAEWREKKLKANSEKNNRAELLSENEQATFAVTAMGPLGHIYLAHSFNDEQKKEFAEWLVAQNVPGVIYKTSVGKVFWIHAQGAWELPNDAAVFLPHPEPLRKEMAQDLIYLTDQKCVGDLILLGWSPCSPPWTFPMERGAHGGPGLEETQGFALLPRRTQLPGEARAFIRPTTLRAAVLHYLGRESIADRQAFSHGREKDQFRIMTYNVHSCIGMDGRISPVRIARIISIYNPDIIALQEIDLGRARSRGHDQAKMIAEKLGFHVCFCPTVIRGNELYGHAILSRYPLETIRTGLLSSGSTRGKKEPRGAIWVRVEANGIRLNLLSTHFGIGLAERTAQAADILSDQWIGGIELNEPLIFCGDFNMTSGAVAYRALTARLHDAQRELKNFTPLKTFAALYPFTRIDHIFVSSHFAVNDVQVPKTDLTRVASDHLPLIADLTFQPGELRNEPTH